MFGHLRALFGVPAGFLDHQRDVGDALGDLLRRTALLARGRFDAAHLAQRYVGRIADALQGIRDLAGQRHGGVDPFGALKNIARRRTHFGLDRLDDLTNGSRGLAGALCQVAHLVGHHRESASGVASARRFDGGVERQQVGLLGQSADGVDDRVDVGRARVQLLDPAGRVAHTIGHPQNLLRGVVRDHLTVVGQSARFA